MLGKVCVIGAGTAGLIFSKELARMGADVTVYDSKRSAAEGSDKASGILSKTGLDRTGIDYRKAVVNTLNGAVLYATNERLSVKSDNVKAYVLDRGVLAGICAEEAAREGVEIRFGEKLSRDQIRGLPREYDVVVGADGAVSTTASAFGFPNINEYVLTYKAEYEGASIPDINSVGLYFDNRTTNRFFGWSVPYSKSVIELGVGVDYKVKKNSKAAFDSFLRNPNVSEIVGDGALIGAHASIIPIQSRKRTVSKNVLLVGDAAGQVKATTGGGIIFGTQCARLAAEITWRHLKEGYPLASYETAWRKRYGMDLSLHKLLHAYYSSLGQRRVDATFKLLKMLGAESFFSEYGDMDRPSVMLKRLFLRGLSG